MCVSENRNVDNIETYIPGVRLLNFEAVCYRELMRHLMRIIRMGEPKPRYGCQPGRNTYISLGLQLDLSVFLYESVKHFSLIAPQSVLQFKMNPEFKVLKIVRNNVHTYFKKGGFLKKSSDITIANLVKYKMIEPDFFYPLRNDISLIFEVIGNKCFLVGSNYFVQHCFFESKKEMRGPDYQEFAKFISSNICSIADTVDKTKYGLTALEIPQQIPNIELFDYKSQEFYGMSDLSQGISFRLILMLHQISYGLILVEEMINAQRVFRDDLWCCFFTKLLAIKYDESFDNLESILKYAKVDIEKLKNLLKEDGLVIQNLKARKFAQKLRNTLHYQEILLDRNLVRNSAEREYIIAIYLSNTGLSNMSQFREFSKCMMGEMKRLQVIIRKIISLDKTY